jgi:hypothetical protein
MESAWLLLAVSLSLVTLQLCCSRVRPRLAAKNHHKRDERRLECQNGGDRNQKPSVAEHAQIVSGFSYSRKSLGPFPRVLDWKCAPRASLPARQFGTEAAGRWQCTARMKRKPCCFHSGRLLWIVKVHSRGIHISAMTEKALEFRLRAEEADRTAGHV